MELKSNLHLFYSSLLEKNSVSVLLDEDESFHAVKVLRLKPGEKVFLLNGKGLVADCLVSDFEKKYLLFRIVSIREFNPPDFRSVLAVCPVKKREKTEWLVEKATETGISEIAFFKSEHSERTSLNYERLQKITVSAIKQSMNPFLPVLKPIESFQKLLENYQNLEDKYIAHCETSKKELLLDCLKNHSDKIALIGPEGGFSENEVRLAGKYGYRPVSLGKNRLRSETAAIYAASFITAFNE